MIPPVQPLSEQQQRKLAPKLVVRQPAFWILSVSVLLCCILFFSLFLFSQPFQAQSSQTARTNSMPLNRPDGSAFSRSASPDASFAHKALVYVQQDGIWLASLSKEGTPHHLVTPHYRYNQAVMPLLTPSGDLIYAADDGIRLLHINALNGTTSADKLLASLADDTVVTSLVLNADGSQMAWSAAPRSGNGTITFYAGSLEATRQIYQQAAGHCPCWRVFAFASASTSDLLLTEDHNDHLQVQHGLWLLKNTPGKQPYQLLPGDPPQGPLAFSSQNNRIVYSSWEGYVPVWEQQTELTSLRTRSYANDLLLSSIPDELAPLRTPQAIVPLQPAQQVPDTQAASRTGTPTVVPYPYHWETTPRFSADGESLLYIQFTVSSQAPFERYSTLYRADLSQVNASTNPLPVQPLATAPHSYVEAGSWIDEDTITLYADQTLYALNIQQGVVTTLTTTNGYAQIIGTATLS